MSELEINSIAAPVVADSWRESEFEIADEGRALSGAHIGTRLESGLKGEWSGKLVVTDALEAWAWRQMIAGAGYGFSFASDLRDDWKGNQGWLVTDATREAGGVFSAGQMSVAATKTTVWTFPAGWPIDRWTLSLYRYSGTAWEHWLKIYNTTTVWKNGTAGVALPSWLTYNSTSITLAGGASAATKYSEIVLWPFKVPTTWPALVAARTDALVKPPYVGAVGRLVGAGETIAERTVKGKTAGAQRRNRGTLDPLETIDFSLEER